MGKARSSRRTSSPASATIQSAEEALRHRKEREEKDRASLDRKADAIAGDYRRRMRDLVGGRKYDELKSAIQSKRLALRELRQPPEGLKRDFWKDQRAGKRQIDALLRKHGVSSSKVKGIRDDTRQKLRKLLAPARADTGPGFSMAHHHDRWEDVTGVGSTDLENTLPPEDPNDPNRWFWFMPQYPKCFHGNGGGADEEFTVHRQTFCTRGGLIGSELSCDVSDAGDASIAYPYTNCFIEFTIQMPKKGLLEVAVRAMCLRDYYEASFEDEFGFSHATVYQLNSLYMDILGENFVPSYEPMSYNDTTSDDPPVMGDRLISGQTYGANFTSNAIVGIAPYTVRIGSINFARVFADDMEVRSRSICLWQIHSVGVRIKP